MIKSTWAFGTLFPPLSPNPRQTPHILYTGSHELALQPAPCYMTGAGYMTGAKCL